MDRLVEPVERGVLAGKVEQQLAGVGAFERRQGELRKAGEADQAGTYSGR